MGCEVSIEHQSAMPVRNCAPRRSRPAHASASCASTSFPTACGCSESTTGKRWHNGSLPRVVCGRHFKNVARAPLPALTGTAASSLPCLRLHPLPQVGDGRGRGKNGCCSPGRCVRGTAAARVHSPRCEPSHRGLSAPHSAVTGARDWACSCGTAGQAVFLPSGVMPRRAAVLGKPTPLASSPCRRGAARGTPFVDRCPTVCQRSLAAFTLVFSDCNVSQCDTFGAGQGGSGRRCSRRPSLRIRCCTGPRPGGRGVAPAGSRTCGSIS